ncbi:cysteine--tRNA ligase [Candidatus Saccharibacteria bacterium]|nr:cysteine--tRNA ligase [Candidatus Saccharibacteria bacterium]
MRLFNTLTRQLENIQPLDGKAFRIYSCGPTVYDYAHIGNLSAYVFADTLRRAATWEGHAPLHVMNYTDIDDKTIRRSRQDYPNDEPETALRALTDMYIQFFMEDMRAVGNDTEAITFVRATDTIGEMQELITRLYEQKFAYVADDGVYFSIKAYTDSGKTYGQLSEITVSSTSESRVNNDEYDKESANDFALWKIQKDGEPAWDFTLDDKQLRGRPGWHIECSAMSRRALGQPFDIHTGGIDLIFPHHENEIAQSTAGNDNSVMATCFAHNNHILVDNKKMAKSAGNFYTLQDIRKRGYDPLAFRMLVLQSHYRSATNFTWENLEAAGNRLSNWRKICDLRHQSADSGAAVFTDSYLEAHANILRQALHDDLDTVTALKEIDVVMNDFTIASRNEQDVSNFTEYLHVVEGLTGIPLLSKDISEDAKKLLSEREEARNNKDWNMSDEIRDNALQALGIGVDDTPHGQLWYWL